MERYGIGGAALNWIQSYLTDRQQYVQMGEFKSERLVIACGAPRGLYWAPNYLIYINHIVNLSGELKLVLFADDTNIFYSSDN